MQTVTITGTSDDLIEIDGDIREEFNHIAFNGDDKGKLLACGDGTVLRIQYDNDGIWRITRLYGGTAEFEKKEGSVEDDTFDVVTLRGEIRWVVLGDEMSHPAKARAAK